MSTGEMNAENNGQQRLIESLRSRMKVQRVYNSANTLANLSDSLGGQMSDNVDVKLSDDELDEINTELQSLQDRLIKAIQP